MEDRVSCWEYVRESELTAAAAAVADPSSEFSAPVPLFLQVATLRPLRSTEVYHCEDKHRSRAVRDRQLITSSSCTRKRLPKRLQRKKDGRRSSGKAEVKCAKEKDRVRNIRIQYNKLRELLGDQQLNKRLNKLKVLNAALTCIEDLRRELDRCSSSTSGKNLYRGSSSYSGTDFDQDRLNCNEMYDESLNSDDQETLNQSPGRSGPVECSNISLGMMTEPGLSLVHQQLTEDVYPIEHQIPFLTPQSVLASPSLAHAFHNQTILSMMHSPQAGEGMGISPASDLVSIAMEPTTCSWPLSPPMIYSPPPLQGIIDQTLI